jgi:integrase
MIIQFFNGNRLTGLFIDSKHTMVPKSSGGYVRTIRLRLDRLILPALGHMKMSDITAHGFRAMASTNLNEQGWPPDVIERQLAHVEENSVRAAYNHAEYLPQRRDMMQWWADWLQGLRG